jgi:alkanesulfonate monooxygenase SsuD/methylene tetrahydromethanopterin reductase-like flavin-dependent oxidoreductase (luciferase family)
MKLGLFQNIQWPEGTNQTQQFRNAIDQVGIAEQLGFESAFFVEHHWTRHGILSSTLATLSHVAAITSTMRLGTAVLVLPFHDPVRLAEEAATVDLLSGGRLDLGVGRGFQWTEFNGFDIPMDESTARYDEALDIILKSWRTEGTFSYDTTTSRLSRSPCRRRTRRCGAPPAASSPRPRSGGSACTCNSRPVSRWSVCRR